ncbi:MAG: ORF6N domain-containing protein [Coriobacteriia bacterium]|nr:ORF6N domain-containing protein [Coriobacteriia bacterium]MCL2749749.1 ORF6N domain-containing protein [Coriobacteriia bacterium]
MASTKGLPEVSDFVLVIRNQQVLIDRDVAKLYGVETKRINEAVKNNPDKFPPGYLITLTNKDKTELVEKFDRFITIKHSTVSPTAFTEKGLYMLATILKSPSATQTTIAIVETFAKIRELSRTISKLPDIEKEDQQKSLMKRSGEILAEVLDDNALEVSGDETTIEVNFAVMRIKHTIKRDKRKKE